MSVTTGVQRRRRRSSVASAAVLAVLSLVVTGFAISYDGPSSSEVEVNNGGVWVMNEQDGLIGRLNVDAQELDSRLSLMGDDLDVQQSGYHVFSTGSRGITPVNTAGVSMLGMVELPSGSQVELGGDRVAIAAADGRVWILTPEQAAAFTPSGAEPVHESSSGTVSVTVSSSATVHVLDGDTLTSYPRTENTAEPETGKEQTIAGVTSTPEHLDLTMVGEQPVILDRENRFLRVGSDGTDIDLTQAGIDAGSAMLQQPGEASDTVVVATADTLYEVPLTGGDPVAHPAGGSGAPVAPAQVAGCSYGAWEGANTYVRACEDGEHVVSEVIPGADADGDLELRVNQDLVVLNDQTFGMSWMIADQMQIVDDWVITQEVKTDIEQERVEETLTSTISNIEADRSQENRPPVANPDQFGVRAGQNIVLPVLRNDTDSDGDVLTAAVAGDQPGIGTVTPIRGGTQLQIVVDEDAAGTASFSYEAVDGRGGSDTAQVTLEVMGPETNSGPVAAEEAITKVQVRSGEEVSFNILPYWQDPEGDSFYLANATVEPEDLVSFRADGLITFNDAGLTTGDKTVQLTFRDEHGGVGEGVLEVEAVTDSDLPPVTTADHTRTVTDRTATVKPLLNDMNPGGGELELTHVAEAEALETDADLAAGTVDVSASEPGTHYIEYTAGSGGTQSATGLIRVDVVEPTQEATQPVAVDDMGLVTVGSSTLIDPLENDVDPSGGVLVVNSAQVPEGSGLKATVVGHHLVRVEAEPNAVPDAELVPITYEVANGSGSVTGTIRVTLAQTDTQFANPVAVPDTATVRAGDVITLDVLDNDVSPTDSSLHLGQILESAAADQRGSVETTQDRVRFIADPESWGEAVLTYEVIDETGRTGSARATIRIVPLDDANDPPRPEHLEARTVAGTPVRIPVALSGVDPDGDSVLLMGVTSPTPQLGTVTSATGEWIEYTPHQGATGTDRFRYQVMDRQGAIGTAEVVVGIAAPHELNQPPYAVDDVVEARPDRDVEIPVLDNDTDPEGAPLSLVRDTVEPTTGIEVHDVPEGEEASRVTVTTPSEPGTHTVLYRASDGQLSSAAAVTVKVDPDAPLLAPIARVDFVDAADVLDPAAEAVEIDALANDQDPDGSVADLEMTLEDAPEGAEHVRDGIVRIVPQDEQMRIRYTLTDPDENRASGYIWVPGTAMQQPLWVGGAVEVQAGSETEIDLADPENVRVRSGVEAASIADPDAVSARWSDGSELVVDETTLRYRPAPDYSGEDTISVQVTDGAVGDRTATSASLAIPVQVTPEESNLPPTLQGALLQIEQSGEQTTLGLAGSAQDPEGDELTFSLGSYEQVDGLSISLDGSTLSAQADTAVAKGTIIDVPVTVTDGTNDPVSTTVQVTVGGSTRPLINTVVDHADIDAGTTDTVDVLANDSNPFPEGERTLTGVSVLSGEGTAEVAGDAVSITPHADFNGILTARYTVLDHTGDMDRQVSGELQVTVRGDPDPPSAPRVGEIGDGTVELNFTAGADNGDPIASYTVTSATGPDVTQECASTSCTITGLQNDVEYTFQVIATNRVGDSQPSTASAIARPDVRPQTPAAPDAARGDQRLTVSWQAPVNRGSAIQDYDLQMQNASTGELETRTDVAGTELVWGDLTNGTEYRFRVRAHNLAAEPSEWSGWSTPEHPAGPPGKPGGEMTAERVNNPLGGGVQVTWPAMTSEEANGEPITAYIVTASSGFEGAKRPEKTYRVTYSNGEPDWADFQVTADANGRASTPRHFYGHPESTGNPMIVELDGTQVGGEYYSP